MQGERSYLALDCCAQVTDKRDKQRISIVCIAVALAMMGNETKRLLKSCGNGIRGDPSLTVRGNLGKDIRMLNTYIYPRLNNS